MQAKTLEDSTGSQIRDMIRSPGWKILENWIKNQIESGIADLMVCPVEEIRQRRASIRTIRGVLCKVRELAEGE